MIADADPIFLDTNILVYASVDTSLFYDLARAAITAFEARHTPLLISRQVLREYLATLARPHIGIPITELTAAVRQFAVRFHIAEEGHESQPNFLHCSKRAIADKSTIQISSPQCRHSG